MKLSGSLVGKFFHTFFLDGKIERQGEVLSRLKHGLYLVENFSWVDGSGTGAWLFKVEDMIGWKFYDTNAEMRIHYDRSPK